MSLPPNKNLLAEYPNRYFVETGSYRGDAIQQALDAGFHNIRSIDLNPANITFCKNRFDLFHRPDPRVKLYIGDSADGLSEMISDIESPITFWLDSHHQLLEEEEWGDNPFPLLWELAQIAEHPIKTHTILIDDILILTHPDVTGWTRKTIEDAILAINPAYKIQYAANPVRNNLMICHL